jgi:hypothetical protein
MGRVKGDSGGHCPDRGRSLTFGSKIRRWPRGQALGHDEGVNGVGIIGAAFAGLDKACRTVKRDGGGVISSDFKEGIGGILDAGSCEELGDKVPCGALPAGIRGYSEGEEFGFTSNSTPDEECMGGGQNKGMVAVQHGREFESGPWAWGGKA